MHRRGFLDSLAGLGMGWLAGTPIKDMIESYSDWRLRLTQTQSEDEFWRMIRMQYTVSGNLLNLNNGGVSPQPKMVQDAHIRMYQYANEAPTYYMWQIMDKGREPLRNSLAVAAGCDPEELAINRNSTEGLNSIIFGLNLKAGDEVVLSKYDYPNMKNAWLQRAKRDGIVLNWIDLPVPCEDKQQIIERYTSAFSSKTKVIHLTRIINWSGQIIPVQEIGAIAQAKGIEVIVDAAHSFGLLSDDLSRMNCDYWATSLHKWLCAPFGSGMMYIKKNKISDVWALLSADEPDGPNIRKFESLGTRSFASEMAIGTALDFHDWIGTERKRQRLHYLKYYWMNQIKDIRRVKLYTSLLPEWSVAIGVFGIEGMTSTRIVEHLFKQYQIHAVGITYEQIDGVRVTPNVYTNESDLDRLVKAIKEIASKNK
jgi:selenocysteine lyase/cysteine desulfurase